MHQHTYTHARTSPNTCTHPPPSAHPQKWASHPDVVYCRPLAAVGAKLTGVQDGFPSWIAEVMVRKQSVQEAVEFVQAVHDDIIASVNITPLPKVALPKAKAEE